MDYGRRRPYLPSDGQRKKKLGFYLISLLTRRSKVMSSCLLVSRQTLSRGRGKRTKSPLLVVTPERMARHSHYVKLNVRRESSSSSLKDNFNYLDSLIPSVFFLCFYHRSYSYAEFITQYLLRVLRLQNKNRQLRHRIQSIYQPSDCNMTGQNSEHESIEYLPALDMIDLLSI